MTGQAIIIRALVFIATASCMGAVTAMAAPKVIGGLPRQAALGFSASEQDGHLTVRRLDSGSAAATAGLRDGDRITQVDGRSFKRPYEGEALLTKLDAGVPIRLTVRRGGKTVTVNFEAPPRPLESIPGVESHYGSVTTPDGARLRTIVTKAKGATGRLRPILFTQWVTCGSIEYRPGGEAREILAMLARESKLALIRVERSADGDSEGPACHELDYDTELSHYTHAFERLLKSEHVDASKIYVYGVSLGSTTAPIIAHALQKKGFDIVGVAIQGGGAETYYERMLTNDRQYLERRPDAVPAAAIHDEMIRRAKFHYEYLIKNRNPGEIARDNREMAAVRKDIPGLGDGEQYGRPYVWHQQAAKHNFLAHWDALDAHVLVIFNEFDQYEGRYGHKLIADMVNRRRPGRATYVEQKNVGHNNFRYKTTEDAYAFRNGELVWRQTAKIILDWLNRVRQ